MELVKNIFFNTDKLIAGNTVKLTYTGKFFEENTDQVFIHFGFGNSWENLTDVKMNKTELGFQTEIKLDSDAGLNLCFNDGNGNWDNNDGNNYSFEVGHEEVSLITTDSFALVASPNRLRKTYLWNKRMKITFYKILTYIPRIINLNYTNKLKDEDQ